VTHIDPAAFARDGYAGPFRAFPGEEMQAYRERIGDVLTRDGLDPNSRMQSRHLDSADVLTLCLAPAIVERVAALLGENLVLWRSNFFEKPPGAPLFDWHRDGDIWGSLLTPMINVSAWIAIDAATNENACVEIFPRSQEVAGAENAGRPMELAPGEFFLFDDALRHRSAANGSARRRLGLAARFTRADTIVDAARLFRGYRRIDVATREAL
jgi:ectoine hydroxylase-related dioxygenase (phytanoyl-CoA dioxygenase family)